MSGVVCRVNRVDCAVFSVKYKQGTIYAVQCPLCSFHCVVHSLEREACSLNHVMNTMLWALCSVQCGCAVCSVQCELCSVCCSVWCSE